MTSKLYDWVERRIKEESDPIKKVKELLERQGKDGVWNFSPYTLGEYNGIELVLATLEGRPPEFKYAPEKWKSEK